MAGRQQEKTYRERVEERQAQERAVADPVAEAARMAEIKQISVLFIVSSIALVLFLIFALARTFNVGLPVVVPWMLLFSFGPGWLVCWVYGTYVTISARRWFWMALIVFFPAAIPGSLMYAWTRRMEIEEEVLGPTQRGRRSSR
jgi:uncharacterized integral membrane protein